MTTMQRKTKLAAVLGTTGLVLLMQVIPYGRDHKNPPVLSEPQWSSAQTRELFFRACGDCHSNQTEWPWYSAIAPASWLVHWDVQEGRSHFNVSDWGRGEQHGDDAVEMVRDGEMPPWFYLPAHPEAQLTEAETAVLIQGLAATFGEGHH